MSEISVTSNQGAAQAENAWRVMFILFLVNLLNFFDRTIPSVVMEPIRQEFSLSDFQLGLLSASFTLVYAIAGIPLGRLADTRSRKKVLSGGLIVWSGLTAATGLAWNYTSLMLIRIGVGVGEASCAPAATSIIGDLFPSQKRARAMGIYMLGLPLGLMLAFFTVGAMVKAFDNSWRAPFFIAAVPGIILGIIVLFIKEPKRGAAEIHQITDTKIENPIRTILKINTVRWVIASGIMAQMAAYSTMSFMVVLLQRFYQLPIDKAALITGGIVGVTGLVAFTLGAQISDRLHQKSETGRLNYGAVSMIVAGIATALALLQGQTGLAAFALLFGLGWLFFYNYYTTVYPALMDVIEPRLRATAMALYFAGQYILGGSLGPVLLGIMSDNFSVSAMQKAGALEMTDVFKGIGLHDAMYLVPITLALTGVFIFLAARTYIGDHHAMLAKMEANSSTK
jgi:MFS family permease